MYLTNRQIKDIKQAHVYLNRKRLIIQLCNRLDHDLNTAIQASDRRLRLFNPRH